MLVLAKSGHGSPHSKKTGLALCLAALMTATLLAGCGGQRGPERVVVSGLVRYNGKPVRDGMIRFTPVAASTAPTSGAAIVDGRYRADSHGGVAVGTYRVLIEAYPAANHGSGIIARDTGAAKSGAPGQYLPARYNTQTQLQLTVESGSREFTKNFDLSD